MTLAGLRPGEKLFEEKLMAEEGLKKTKNKLIHIGCPIPFNTEQLCAVAISYYLGVGNDALKAYELGKRSVIGLGDQAVKEAAERIQAAIDESGYVFPKKRVYWIWLTQIPFIGPIAARKLIEYFENAENVYKAKEKYLEKIPGLSIKQKKNVIEFRSLKEAERILENCEKQSIDAYHDIPFRKVLYRLGHHSL